MLNVLAHPGSPRWPLFVFSWGLKQDAKAKTPHRATAAPRALAGASPPSNADIERFKALFLPHLDAANRFARMLARDPARAEDIVQDAYIRALRAFPNYRGGDAKAWLFAIVRNRFLSHVRDTAMEYDVPEHADANTPEALLIARQDHDRLQRLIERLPTALREVIVLREIDDMAYREIATAIDAPIGTVMSRLARARTALAAALRAELDREQNA